MRLLETYAGLVVAWSNFANSRSSACQQATNQRECHAQELLQTLVAGGATVAPVGLHARERLTGGLGIFVSHPVPENTTVLTIPRQLWLASTFCPPNSTACAGERSFLVVRLGRERQAPSAPHLAAYLKTLPADCPPNLAAMPVADVDLVAASPLYGEWIENLQMDLEILAQEMPEVNETERRLLTCLTQSRAMSDNSQPASEDSYTIAMIPFADLLNHAPERSINKIWDAERGLSLVTARNLDAGDELVFPYSTPFSKTYMLLAFGFRPADAPAAAIPVDDLGEDDETGFFRQQGCEGRPHIRLHENVSSRDSEVGEAELRTSLRCVRLRSYTPEMAAWALSSGYLDESLLSPRSAFAGETTTLYEECVRKDAYVAYFVMHACASKLYDDTSEEFARFATLLEADGISDDVREALQSEDAALRACNDIAVMVLHNLVGRGCGVEEMLNQLAEESPFNAKDEL